MLTIAHTADPVTAKNVATDPQSPSTLRMLRLLNTTTIREPQFNPGALMNLRLASLLFLGAVGTASFVQAQSIADLAKKAEEAKAKKAAEQAPPEGEKKDDAKAKDAPKKTFTNTDLGGSSSSAPPPSDASNSKSDVQPKDTTQKPDAKDATAAPSSGETKDENWWRSHALALKRQRDDDTTALLAARAHFDSLPDQAKGVLGVPIVDAWMKARAEISRLEGVVANDRRAVNDFEEEARRAGIPPGWLREK